jgi:hypothetical protein
MPKATFAIQTLALASDLAYLAEPEGVEGFRSQLGLEARLFSVGNTQAYVATNDDHIVVAFRGTEFADDGGWTQGLPAERRV